MDSAFPMSANPPSDTLPFGDAHEALVHARRSVRAYRPDPVPDALLHQLLPVSYTHLTLPTKRIV